MPPAQPRRELARITRHYESQQSYQTADGNIRHKSIISYHSTDAEEVLKFVNDFDSVFIPRSVGLSDEDGPLVDSDDGDYVTDTIRDKYLRDSTVTIVMIGRCTWSRRFVDAEVYSSLRRGKINRLNGLNQQTDEDVQAFFDEHREERYDRVAARHILTETEAEADEALARLEAGEDFAEVAAEMSIDPGSAEEGGSLGEFGRGQMVPEFEDAAFAATEGEVVGPVESQFGFHIIEVTSRVQLELADVEDEIREELRQTLDADATQEWLQGQLEVAEVEVNPRFGSWDADLGEVVPTDPLGEEPAPPVQPEDDMELPPEG
jgi:hypothetical protein